MKFKVGDTVLITSGKDKGKKSSIVAVLPEENKVIVEGINMYTRHIKPMFGQPGDKVRKERPMSVAKIAIINDQGNPDRIGYSISKSGKKERIFRKTGKAVDAAASATKSKKQTKKSKK